MAERLNKCPKCGATQWGDDIVKVHNPDTTDMNMKATLRCVDPDCGHEWEGLVMSNHHRRGRERGEYI